MSLELLSNKKIRTYINRSNDAIVDANVIAGFNKMTESWFEEDLAKEFNASCKCDCCVVDDFVIIR